MVSTMLYPCGEKLGSGSICYCELTDPNRSAALLYARGNVRLSRADHTRKDVRKSLLDHMEAVSRARRSAGAKNRTTLICQYQVARVSAKLGKYETAW